MGRDARHLRRLTAPPCSRTIVVPGLLIATSTRSCISGLPCARIAARLAYFFGSRAHRRPCRYRHEVESTSAPANWRPIPQLLGVFSSFSRRGPPPEPNIEPPSAVIMMSAIDVSTTASCLATPAPICLLYMSRASSPSRASGASFALVRLAAPDAQGTPAIHQDAPCIDCRPAQRPTSLSGLANCYAPSCFRASRSAGQSLHQRRIRGLSRPKVKAHPQPRSTALSPLFFARGGAWRVQHRSSNRHSTDVLSRTLNI